MNDEIESQIKEACTEKAIEILKKPAASPDELRIALELAVFGTSRQEFF